MADLRYEYKILSSNVPSQFESVLNSHGYQGWRVVHYWSQGTVSFALMELSKPLTQQAKE